MGLFGMFGNKPPILDRETAMGGFPMQLPDKGREEKGEKLYVTIEFHRPRWQQVLGADEVCERTFGLDPYGREVFEACTGKNSVDQIVKQFARNHKISVVEAEICVSSFLKTLMSHGMVAMELKDMSPDGKGNS